MRGTPVVLSPEARESLAGKIRRSGARLSVIASDPEVCRILGCYRCPLPLATLKFRLGRTGLEHEIYREKRLRRDLLDAGLLWKAVQRHGSIAAACALLGWSPRTLLRSLQEAGFPAYRLQQGSQEVTSL